MWTVWPSSRPFGDSKLSAIAAVYTKKAGFVVGADGRAELFDRDAATEAEKQMENEHEQKIFEAIGKGTVLTYGCPEQPAATTRHSAS